MLFNSATFLIFFPMVVALYFALPHRFRWALLLGASYYFYMCWRPEYAVLIAGSTLVDYGMGLQMGRQDTRRGRLPFLLVSLAANLGLLFTFKYLGFFSDSLEAFLGLLGQPTDVPSIALALPVGISFYTFQTLSYAIDVYRGDKEPEPHLGIFALYVSFFPQLVAGPIERSTRLLPQFFVRHHVDYARITDGLKLMLWGFFKKVVIADRIAIYVNTVYNNPGAHEGLAVWLATYLFAVQIYCDFSGYSDIAIGGAKVLGFDLMENFRRPYFAKSIRSFWRRWHISLSTWFRDYVYIALGGNRVSAAWWIANIMIVFVVSGLWHGAAWTFAIWGALHGAYLLAGVATQSFRDHVWKQLRVAYERAAVHRTAGASGGWLRLNRLRDGIAVGVTFHLVCLGWVFFRANSLSDAMLLLRQAVRFSDASVMLPSFGLGDMAVSGAAIAVLVIVHCIERKENIRRALDRHPVWVRWPVYLGVVLTILTLGVFDAQEFIYFQF